MQTGEREDLSDQGVEAVEVGLHAFDGIGFAAADEFERDAETSERRAQFVGDVAEKFLLLLQERLDLLGHAIEVAGEVGEFVIARRNGGDRAHAEIAAGNSAGGSLQRADGRGDVARENQAEKSGGEQRDGDAQQESTDERRSDKAAQRENLRDEDVIAFRARDDRGAGPTADAHAELRFPGGASFFEKKFTARRKAAREHIVRLRIEEHGANAGIAFDIVEILAQLPIASGFVKVHGASAVVLERAGHPAAAERFRAGYGGDDDDRGGDADHGQPEPEKYFGVNAADHLRPAGISPL